MDLPSPLTSEHPPHPSIPSIPILPLPHLPSSTLLPSANLFSSVTSIKAPGLTSLTQKSGSTTAGLSNPFVLEENEDSQGKVVRIGSVQERKQAMMDRVSRLLKSKVQGLTMHKIKARSGSSKTALPTLGSSVGGLIGRSSLSAAMQQEELKRRSTLSRLESIAEGVWM